MGLGLPSADQFSNNVFLNVPDFDLSDFLIVAGVVLLALASMWAIKKALLLIKG
ncbi:MAG: hypothetical protein WCW84_04760 [Sulfurimonas sp.]|jgi:hypothetical protein